MQWAIWWALYRYINWRDINQLFIKSTGNSRCYIIHSFVRFTILLCYFHIFEMLHCRYNALQGNKNICILYKVHILVGLKGSMLFQTQPLPLSLTPVQDSPEMQNIHTTISRLYHCYVDTAFQQFNKLAVMNTCAKSNIPDLYRPHIQKQAWAHWVLGQPVGLCGHVPWLLQTNC